MEHQKFWDTITVARQAAGTDVGARVETLKSELMKLSLSDVQEFQHNYEAMIGKANRWNLWGAAYLMNGGCSDDGFRYFCDWLISEGQEVFDKAIENPDSLADLPPRDYFELESFAYVALEVYEIKGGGELERDFSSELSIPAGEEWEEEQLPSLFPRLDSVYGGELGR